MLIPLALLCFLRFLWWNKWFKIVFSKLIQVFFHLAQLFYHLIELFVSSFQLFCKSRSNYFWLENWILEKVLSKLFNFHIILLFFLKLFYFIIKIFYKNTYYFIKRLVKIFKSSFWSYLTFERPKNMKDWKEEMIELINAIVIKIKWNIILYAPNVNSFILCFFFMNS